MKIATLEKRCFNVIKARKTFSNIIFRFLVCGVSSQLTHIHGLKQICGRLFIALTSAKCAVKPTVNSFHNFWWNHSRNLVFYLDTKFRLLFNLLIRLSVRFEKVRISMQIKIRQKLYWRYSKRYPWRFIVMIVVFY